MGYEIIDQNNFYSPTLNKELNEDLSSINQKSIVLPLGEVKITRRIKSILIIFRTNTEIEIWDQNKKRLFEKHKIEYSLRSLNSLIKSINFCYKKYPNIKINLLVVDDNSKKENLNKLEKLIDNRAEITNLKRENYKNKIRPQTNEETIGNLASLYQCWKK